MKLLSDLVFKTYKNDLSITISPTNSGHVTVWDHDAIPGESVLVTRGSLKSAFKDADEELKRMHLEVDDYLYPPVDEYDEHYIEEARAMLTEQEREMRDVGHKESDFR